MGSVPSDLLIEFAGSLRSREVQLYAADDSVSLSLNTAFPFITSLSSYVNLPVNSCCTFIREAAFCARTWRCDALKEAQRNLIDSLRNITASGRWLTFI